MLKIDSSLMFKPSKVGEMASELEACGFDGAYTFEGQGDPFIGVAAAAMSTSRMDLMTSIAVAFVRNPMSLAYLGTDLQDLSGGRFIMGLGTQVKAHVERRFSMPWSKPAARMRETVLAVRTIWDSWKTGERLNFEGEFYRHNLMSPTFSPDMTTIEAPPVYIAGVGPKMTEVVGEVGDGYFVHPFHTATSLEQLSRPALQRGLDKSGRTSQDLVVSAQVITASGLNEEELQAAIGSARHQIAFYASTPAYLPVLETHGLEGLQAEAAALLKQGKWLELGELISDDILHMFALVGEPVEVASKLHDRFDGKVDRVSPVIYAPRTELLVELLKHIRQS
jgi:probable F420-dependent oxidoreductase